MGRRIVVSSNCQTGGLHTTLSAMLPEDSIAQTIWVGAETAELHTLLADADVWVTSAPREVAQSILSPARRQAQTVIVPTPWFTGFHPDQTPIMRTTGEELQGACGPYHSKIVMWSMLHGLTPAQTIRHFSPETFAGLGYFEAWRPAVDLLRTIFEPTDIDFGQWLLPLSRRGVFMLTNNHPRVDAIVQTARLVAGRLGADPASLNYEWELVVPDGLLATSFVWPIYPGIADVLDLPGAYIWRLGSGEFIGLEEFVIRSFAAYESVDPSTIDTAHIDLDPRFAMTLGTGRA